MADITKIKAFVELAFQTWNCLDTIDEEDAKSILSGLDKKQIPKGLSAKVFAKLYNERVEQERKDMGCEDEESYWM